MTSLITRAVRQTCRAPKRALVEDNRDEPRKARIQRVLACCLSMSAMTVEASDSNPRQGVRTIEGDYVEQLAEKAFAEFVRMLDSAANTLGWEERADMRRITDTIVSMVRARQRQSGYCLPYDKREMHGNTDAAFTCYPLVQP